MQTMAPLRASCSTLPIPLGAGSRMSAVYSLSSTRLGRHVSQLNWLWSYDVAPDPDLLTALSQRMPWIEALQLRVEDQDGQRACQEIAHLTRMRQLVLRCSRHFINPLLAVVGSCMPELESLVLHSSDFDVTVCLAPLVALPHLRLLELITCPFAFGSSSPFVGFTPSQLAALRGLSSSLEYLNETYSDGPSFLVALLQPHHKFERLRLPDRITVTDELAPLLSSLPQLRALTLVLSCASFDFLAQLPALSKLVLELNSESDAIDVAGLVSVLQRCPQLTQLALRRLPLEATDLAALLPSLPLLSSLKLAYLTRLDSLRFLATASVASSLTRLIVGHCPACAPAELIHLQNLRRLRRLEVERLSAPVPVELKTPFELPSEIMPHLISLKLR